MGQEILNLIPKLLFLTCDGFFREPVSGRLKLCARPAEVVIGGVVLLDGVTWPWVVTGPPGLKAGGLGREKERVNQFLRLGRSFEVLNDLSKFCGKANENKSCHGKFAKQIWCFLFPFNSQLDYCYCTGRRA